MKLSASFLGSSAVEQSAVNRWVVGSNPIRGDPIPILLKICFDLVVGRFPVTVPESPSPGGNNGPSGVLRSWDKSIIPWSGVISGFRTE
uniref:Uncharacterized protein n=1 Tax=Psilotum nudum TaxID=3240 RepID=Q8W8D2_PSINU|nr:hypothetical protein PsnuCp072 [Psilotum nudum]NP_569701.1 hypothetical protein PsnuCp096 [Psilotum nudum]BAB84266.1 hypothetical protein [Psilotum nudum]BAB84290.1 hypothetical protein [Psilotum nudum]